MSRPTTTAARLAYRQVRTGVIILALAAAATFASVVSAYEQVVHAAGNVLGPLTKSPALRLLYGTPTNLSIAGGFAVWRSGQFMAVVAGLWAIFATTRILRGEEENGRTELLLGGRLSHPQLVAGDIAVLSAGALITGLAVTLGFLAEKAPVAGSVLFGAGLGFTALLFVGVAAITSQLFAQRRRAAGVGSAVLGGFFLLRVLSNSSERLAWLRWLTPFGWVQSLQPFGADVAWPLLLLVVSAAACFVAALALLRRRDLDAGNLRGSDTAKARTRLLGSPLDFALRERLGPLLSWSATIAGFGLVIGAITATFADFLRNNPSMLKVLGHYGFADAFTAKGFIGSVGPYVAVAFALYCVAAFHATWEDEQQGRLEHVFAEPVSRSRWLLAQTAATLLALAVIATVYTVALWVGVLLGGATLSLGDAFAATLNMMPVALLFAGISILLIGLRPETQIAIAGGAAALSLFVSIIGPIANLPTWLIDLSPIRHLAAVPAVPINMTASLAMVTAALATSAIGVFAYARRNLR